MFSSSISVFFLKQKTPEGVAAFMLFRHPRESCNKNLCAKTSHCVILMNMRGEGSVHFIDSQSCFDYNVFSICFLDLSSRMPPDRASKMYVSIMFTG